MDIFFLAVAMLMVANFMCLSSKLKSMHTDIESTLEAVHRMELKQVEYQTNTVEMFKQVFEVMQLVAQFNKQENGNELRLWKDED